MSENQGAVQYTQIQRIEIHEGEVRPEIIVYFDLLDGLEYNVGNTTDLSRFWRKKATDLLIK